MKHIKNFVLITETLENIKKNKYQNQLKYNDNK